jgi:hypothetical protein
MNKIILTKKIAKQGKNSIIVIPSYLREVFKPGSVVKVEIENLELNSFNENKEK